MKSLLLAALLAASLGGGLASLPPANADVTLARLPPPPPRDEAVPAVRRGHLWTPGYWHWNGSRHIWVKGKYVRARDGYYWREPAWAQLDSGHWRLERGRWERSERSQDGVAHRRDHHPDNPFRQ